MRLAAEDMDRSYRGSTVIDGLPGVGCGARGFPGLAGLQAVPISRSSLCASDSGDKMFETHVFDCGADRRVSETLA